MTHKNVINVEVEKDFINRSLKGSPLQALTELVWNAFDADADNVNVNLNYGELGLDSIEVIDDGVGIEKVKFQDFFKSLGSSWKKTERLTPSGRYLHGKLGQGRFKAFVVGRSAEWSTIYKNKEGQYLSYKIHGLADNPKEFRFTDEVKANQSITGTRVQISEFNNKLNGCLKSKLIELFSTVFANYLNKYPRVKLFVDNEHVDPSKLIISKEKIQLDPVEFDGERYDYELSIIEWNFNTRSEVHFCNANGLPIQPCNSKPTGAKGFRYTAYLKSEHISILSDKGLLEFDSLEPTLKQAVENCISSLSTYFQRRKLEKSVSKIERWKTEKVYPYSGTPSSPIEVAEKELFDILALNISDSIPNFEKTDVQLKKFQLQLLKQIVNTKPSDLQKILEEVLNLSAKKQKELAELIDDVSLNSIINMSKVVIERINFITGLEEILFNLETKKNLKERAQLHKILADNTWIFGDAYSMTVNDQSLTQVLKKHLNHKNDHIIIDENVTRLDGRNGIVDLMLSQRMPTNHCEEVEHLVVELKAPKVKIGVSELTQIKSYAFAIAGDERFDNLEARWNFMVISNELDKYTIHELKNDKTGKGILYDADNIIITVKTWSQIIQECKHRLNFLREELNLNITSLDGLKHLKKNYAKYTEGIVLCD